MAKQKQPRIKAKELASGEKTLKAKDAANEQPGDPLRAFPADPPRPHLALLIVSAVLFAVWFCYLAYLAIAS